MPFKSTADVKKKKKAYVKKEKEKKLALFR